MIPYGTCVPVAVRLVTNCYIRLLYLLTYLRCWQLDVLAFAAGVRLAEWVPYVQAARDADEQNMEALIDDGQLYFRVTRTIAANSELLIWYSDKLATRIGVPELPRDDPYCTGEPVETCAMKSSV